MPTSSCQSLYHPCQRACQKTRPAVGGRSGEIRIGVGTANEGTQAPEASSTPDLLFAEYLPVLRQLGAVQLRDVD
eukprot:815767-Prymnesium_polylepis.1